MKRTKTILTFSLTGALAISALTGCGNSSQTAAPETAKIESSSNTSSESSSSTSSESSSNASGESSFNTSSEIGVISREDGSGTRGAFIELFGIEQKDASGEKVDHTTDLAAVTNSTSVMMTTVAGDLYSIGYISLGSLNDTVKAVQIDGVDASAENIKNGSYKVSRPFNIAVKDNISETAQDFIDFIMSSDGQAVIEENGYIPVSDAAPYSGSVSSGKIKIAGSSSVTPVMEKLKEAYLEKNPDVTIELQQSDSSTGMSDTIDGTCDIGMASRELKDSETEKGLTPMVIAMDGIAVIVNNNSIVTNLTSDQVRDIFTGTATVWNDVIQN